mgnify:CR=1 FL=1
MFDSFDPLALVALVAVLGAFSVLVGLRLKRIGFTSLVLIALAVGVGIGVLFQGHLAYVDFIGQAYIQAILAVVAPLIFISILSSITSLGSTRELRTIGLSSIFWLLLTNAIAIVLTLAIALSIGLGEDAQLDLAQGSDATGTLTGMMKPLDQVLLGLLPSNLAGDFASTAIVPIILFAVLFAVAFLVANRSGGNEQLRTFKQVVDGTKTILMTAVTFVIELTPYAVLALVATTTATAIGRIETVISLLAVLVLAFVITFLNAYGVNAVLLRVFADVNPLHWFRLLTPAQYTAFTTQSSVGTLPITIPTLTRKVGVPENIAAFTAPIGTTLGMPGCSGIWPILVAVFSINALGIEYTLLDYITLAAICLLVSLGTAGVPGTAIITATAVLSATGLPLEILVLLIPISAVAGTASTMSNVSAAATAATIVARRQGVLDDAVFRGERGPEPTPAASAQQLEIPKPDVAPLQTKPLYDESLPIGQCELPGARSQVVAAADAKTTPISTL